MVKYGGDKWAAKRKHYAAIPQSFFCRSCGRRVDGITIPHGWYELGRHDRDSARPLSLGLYCALACLAAMMPRVAGIETDLAERNQP